MTVGSESGLLRQPCRAHYILISSSGIDCAESFAVQAGVPGCPLVASCGCVVQILPVEVVSQCVLEFEVAKVARGTVCAWRWCSEAGVATPYMSRLCRSHILYPCRMEVRADLLLDRNLANLFVSARSGVPLVMHIEARVLTLFRCFRVTIEI